MIDRCSFVANFNPRPPRGGRPGRSRPIRPLIIDFNPRPPRGERRGADGTKTEQLQISIHALREESDSFFMLLSCCGCNFNPRPPRGERRSWRRPAANPRRFQSTPSARRATSCPRRAFRHRPISIHALREESDPSDYRPNAWTGDFNPRPPRGERQQPELRYNIEQEFQSTPSARRATESMKIFKPYEKISIHALREESDSASCRHLQDQFISIHALREESDCFR